MKIFVKFLPLFFLLLIIGSGCKGLKNTDGHHGLLRYSGDDKMGSINISDLIDSEKLTLICVRHAEKIKGISNPSLTKDGIQRAEDLSTLLTSVNVDAIYSSDYNRTIETVQDLSIRTKVPIQRYDPRELDQLKNTIMSNHQNEVVVVVGHSNSTPQFINTLLSEDKYSSFDESDYDNIFIVSISADGEASSHLLEYGAESIVSPY